MWGEPGQARLLVRQAAAAARENLAEARRIIRDLAPVELERKGLADVLRELCAGVDWVDRVDGARFRLEGEPRPVPGRVEGAVLRAAQGALANVRRHARASAVVVTLTYQPYGLSLDVWDDGVGFEPAAAASAAELGPELVLMDIRMGPGMCGVETTRRIGRLPAPPRVVVLSSYESDAYVVRAVEAGVAGYLLKGSPPDLLFQALRTVAAGESALSPSVVSRLMNRYRAPSTALTARETEILELIATGRSNREIGSVLFISGTTVKTHLVHVYEKLGVENRTAAVRAAVDRGLIGLG